VKKYVLAIDQGTSSTKSVIFDEAGEAVCKGYADLHTTYFDNGFVEQDAENIFQNVNDSVANCLAQFIEKGLDVNQIQSCGISNQRETFILWDKDGNPLIPAIVWACKRSVEICNRLISLGQNEVIKQKTGLIIDPYFSATKLLWLIENNAELKLKLERGEVYFGTVDCWLLWKMTKGKSYKTDYTNAHRTLLFNIHTIQWDREILELWGLQKLNLPEVVASSYAFGEVSNDHGWLGEKTLPITAMIGDSHAAAFGEGCFEKGMAKVTMGTGSSIMLNIGDKPLLSDHGMLTTICWSLEGRIDYALEGAIVACGSTIEWLKNELHLFEKSSETEAMANAVDDNAGVYFIPAFSGLGAPHWQMNRKASIEGLTFGTSKNHIVRAALESIPYQIKDVIDAMSKDMQSTLKSMSINGGIANNKFVVTFLADLLKLTLNKKENTDVSALGAAYLSGLKSGVYNSLEQLISLNGNRSQAFVPSSRDLSKYYIDWRQKIEGGPQTKL
jgi:glycerol kinase